MDLLFVYGTLRSEFDNPYARLLRANAVLAGNATVRGSVRIVNGYLAYSRQPDGEVHGELYRLHDPETTLRALDSYEGEGYDRVVVQAGDLEAWIYQEHA